VNLAERPLRVSSVTSHETQEKCSFSGIATRRGPPEDALSYFISPFVKPPREDESSGDLPAREQPTE